MIPTANNDSVTLHCMPLRLRPQIELTLVRALPLPVFTNPDASKTVMTLHAASTLSFVCYGEQNKRQVRNTHPLPIGCTSATGHPCLQQQENAGEETLSQSLSISARSQMNGNDEPSHDPLFSEKLTREKGKSGGSHHFDCTLKTENQ